MRGRTDYGCVPAFAVQRLLGEWYCGRVVPLDAVYFWDGRYYPAADLAYDAGRHEVTMPDGVTLAGDCAVFLYDRMEGDEGGSQEGVACQST